MALPSAASVVSSGLTASPTIYYDRVAVETLRSNLFLYPACDIKQMPEKSGVAMQLFGYTKFAANTTPATEGTPGAGQALTQVKTTLNLSQFVDYVSFSDKVVMTSISPVVEEGAKELAYRGAASVDTVISTVLDTEANSDASACIDLLDGVYFTAAVSRHAAMKLRSLDVKPKANGKFLGVINSLQAYDMINDTAAGGFIDLQKFSVEGERKLAEGIDGKNFIGEVAGVEWFESNALPSEAAWLSSSHIGYHAYIIGQDGVIASSLGKTMLGQKNFGVKVSKFDQPIAVDPANQIAAAAAYNFFFGAVTRPGTINSFLRVRSESSIG